MTKTNNAMKFFDDEDVVVVKSKAKAEVAPALAEAESEAPVRSAKVSQGVVTNNPKLAQQAIQKLNDIEKELNVKLVEREVQIRDLMRAIASGKHILLLGPPGTGSYC